MYSKRNFACCRAAELETPSTHIHKFSDPREVEITSRVLRVWIDEDHLDPGRVALAERIMRAGKSQLGSSPYMSILWSSFLIDVQVRQGWRSTGSQW
jgi:hypothetical protein